MPTNALTAALMARRKTSVFVMRMNPVVLAAAKEAAADERRSVAALIEYLLEMDLRRRGYLRPDRPRKQKGRPG
jgi:hypothetical protein